MTQEVMNSWITKAKNNQAVAAPPKGVKVVKRETQTRGNMIIEMAERLYPWFRKILDGVRDNDGMLLQPAHIRGIALDVAQGIVAKQNAN